MDTKFYASLEPMTDALIKEQQVIIEHHYQEVARKDLYPVLDPDWDFYKMAQEQGFLKVFTLRLTETKELVGYWWFFVRKNPHYKYILTAADDIIFVEKKYRGKDVREFMKWCLRALELMGVKTVVLHCKVAFDLQPLYTSLGFEPHEKNFIRSL
jgi:GNAT superfamily N-acetyltransferase